MYLQEIQIRSFRNLKKCHFDLHPNLNWILGKNGQGKTNFLEAIYTLSHLKSFRPSHSRDLIQFHEPMAKIQGIVNRGDLQTRYELSIGEKEKKALINGKSLKSILHYFGKLTVIAFHPEDLRWIKGTPQERRAILDRIIFHFDSGYAKLASDYQRALKNRNQLLKNRSTEGIEIWEEQLAKMGAQIMLDRQKMVQELKVHARHHYDQIASNEERLEVRYSGFSAECHRLLGEISLLKLVEQLKQELAAKRAEDQFRGYTRVGPHRHDIEVLLNDQPMKTTASQGQQRTAVLAWKLAELSKWREACAGDLAKMPILLIDDLSSELDSSRREKLLQFVLEYPSQVFVTSTETGGSASVLKNGSFFLAHEGDLQPIRETVNANAESGIYSTAD